MDRSDILFLLGIALVAMGIICVIWVAVGQLAGVW